MQEPPFPRPIHARGRIYFLTSAVNDYKDGLIEAATGFRPQRETKKKKLGALDEDPLLPAAIVARELGMSRRTLARRIAAISPEGGLPIPNKSAADRAA